MSLSRSWLRAASLAGLIAAVPVLCAAQTPAEAQPAPTTPTPAAASMPSAPPAQISSDPSGSPHPTINVPRPADAGSAAPASADEPTAPQKKTYTVPAGTKILLELRSAINTKSAKAGDGVYLSSKFPVVVGNRVMIPNGVYVQGVVDRVQRGGRIKGKAQLDMHFTSIIFPNGSVVEVPGVVDSVPGAKDQTVKDDGEGTIEQNGDKGRNAGTAAEIALPSGAGIGTIGGAASGHPIEGGLAGLGAGLATVGIVSLFTRNADVDIPRGTQVEMVLQRPLLLEEQNLAGVSQPGTAPALVPSANQPRPISTRRPRILCPPGGLGCE
ncbi:MAG: hypothetical protein WBC92_11855 [Terracidiphilus sp.]